MMAFAVRLLVVLSLVANGIWCIPSDGPITSQKYVPNGSVKALLSKLRGGGNGQIPESGEKLDVDSTSVEGDLDEEPVEGEFVDESLPTLGEGLGFLGEVGSIGESVRRVVERIERDNSADAEKLREAMKAVALKFMKATEVGLVLGASEASRGAKKLKASVERAAKGLAEQLRTLQSTLKNYIDKHPQLKEDVMKIGLDTMKSVRHFSGVAVEASKGASEQLRLGADFLRQWIENIASTAAKAAEGGKHAIEKAANDISAALVDAAETPEA